MTKTELAKLPTASIQTWLKNHVEAIGLGVNVGEINCKKAQAFRLELIRRTS